MLVVCFTWMRDVSNVTRFDLWNFFYWSSCLIFMYYFFNFIPKNIIVIITDLFFSYLSLTVIRQQMILRKELFLKALTTKNVKILPRLIDKDKIIKCKHCQYNTRCWEQDTESVGAMKLAIEHQTTKLLGDIGIGIMVPVTNHID